MTFWGIYVALYVLNTSLCKAVCVLFQVSIYFWSGSIHIHRLLHHHYIKVMSHKDILMT